MSIRPDLKRIEVDDTLDVISTYTFEGVKVRTITSSQLITSKGAFDLDDAGYSVSNIKRVAAYPEHWPPRINDVWSVDAGTSYYHCLYENSELKLVGQFTANSYKPEDMLRKFPTTLKLVYRAGNNLNDYRKQI